MSDGAVPRRVVGPPPTMADKVFCVSFETKGLAGHVKAVKVTIEEDIVLVDEAVLVDLADHPLYAALQHYVRSNPR